MTSRITTESRHNPRSRHIEEYFIKKDVKFQSKLGKGAFAKYNRTTSMEEI